YRFPNTILLVTTTGEEQGLIGANAMAQYFADEDIGIKVVQNNDIVGGIICGETSSPPSCPGLNHVDSTQVRLFSRGSFNSPHKALCRYIKLQYTEMIEPLAPVPMHLTIMSAEDRSGRGGDHIPYRQRGYPAMRVTSANEHGNANTGDPDYHDRQHTSQDLLGVDTDNDGELDSFFVDFNYLARNAVINANAVVMAAIGPQTPEIASAFFDGDTIYIELASEIDYPRYVLGVRTDTHDFDSLYYMDSKFGVFVTAEREFSVFLSAASIDSNGVESLFSEEVLNLISGTDDPAVSAGPSIRLMGNRPNPFDEATTLSFWVEHPISYRSAHILITDLQGRKVAQLETEVRQGLNELVYHHGYGMTGILVQTLVIDGAVVDTKQMIYAN
ncbi:MAG: M28 family peptidase, partial [Saprospiraceae bacterium]|nr:M28 family peptidase [Saprospiraceae bacterium]